MAYQKASRKKKGKKAKKAASKKAPPPVAPKAIEKKRTTRNSRNAGLIPMDVVADLIVKGGDTRRSTRVSMAVVADSIVKGGGKKRSTSSKAIPSKAIPVAAAIGNGGVLITYRSRRLQPENPLAHDLRKRCGLLRMEQPSSNAKGPDRTCYQFMGRAPCQRKECSKIVGLRSRKSANTRTNRTNTAKNDKDSKECDASCPDQQFYCSELCRKLDGHVCSLFKYNKQPVNEHRRSEERKMELVITKDVENARTVVADVPILLRVPRASCFQKPGDGELLQVLIPCIQCGILQDNFIMDKQSKGRASGITIMQVVNFDSTEMADVRESILLKDNFNERCCKICKWPVCAGCSEEHQHTECYQLSRIYRLIQKQGLPHPVLRNPDYGMLFIGMARLALIKSNKDARYSKFKELVDNFGVDKGHQLSTYETNYSRLFQTQFSDYLGLLKYYSTSLEKKEIDTLLYYRVHSASIAWPQVITAQTPESSAIPGIIPGNRSTTITTDFIVIGLKIYFGCIPTCILVKSEDQDRIQMKTLRPLNKADHLCLPLNSNGDSTHIQTLSFTDEFFPHGRGDWLYERDICRNDKSCSLSTCEICKWARGHDTNDTNPMRRLLRIEEIKCESCQRVKAYTPRVFSQITGRNTLYWECTNPKCNGTLSATARRRDFKVLVDKIQHFLTGKVEKMKTFDAFMTRDLSKQFSAMERIMAFSYALNMYHNYLKTNLNANPISAEIDQIKHTNIRQIYDMLVSDLNTDPYLFQYESGMAKIVSSMGYILASGKLKPAPTDQEFAGNYKQLVAGMEKIETVSGYNYNPQMLGKLANVMDRNMLALRLT